MIARINVDGKTTKADWLDLILSLKSKTSSVITVMRKENGRIARDKKDVYMRNNQGVWIQTRVKGNDCDRPIRVVKENRQYIIQYI